MEKISRRYKKLLELSKDKKSELIDNAIKKVKVNCTSKFDESIDISLNLNLKQKKEETTLRTSVNLPHGNGKKLRVAALCEDGKIQDGAAALIAFGKMQFTEMGDDERAALKAALLRYCELDTLAMVMIYEHWNSLK